MDIMNLYPIKSDIFTKHEKIEPHYYNYMCIHGYQLYLRVNKKKYQILTASWFPCIADRSKYVFTDRIHLVYEGTSWLDTCNVFRKCAEELIVYSNYGELIF